MAVSPKAAPCIRGYSDATFASEIGGAHIDGEHDQMD
jgi:hypothetical protein